MPTSSEIRQQFIDFFCKKHGHTFVASSPVVPHDDPTLLFANAGMNQFKPYFLGTEKPKFTRVANTQKCIRAGGKHNDLDDVGKDTYHHTFFEMLGNWSFGDYFKKDAIAWAWELLTEVWKLDKTRLHVTVFEGDPDNGIPRDDEAAEIWKKVGVLNGHIHLGNKKDNFWEMGNTGPCGPCTEIHFDKTPDKSGAKLVNGGSDQCIEIWNNVFIQFNRNEDQSLTPLPAQHVDTGMGFERICAILNGKPSNYDTDVFTPLFEAIQQVTGARPYGGKLNDLIDTAYRVIADHIRTLTFAITDGGVPSNIGRGYVIRSVLRRAVRYGSQQLGIKEPFLYKLVPTLISEMGSFFPELKRDPEKVISLIYGEEKGFLKTLERGIERFMHAFSWAIAHEIASKEKKAVAKTGPLIEPRRLTDGVVINVIELNQGNTIEEVEVYSDPENVKKLIQSRCNRPPVLLASDAFKLHTEQGLFIEIVEQMALEFGGSVDRPGYDRLFEQFKVQSAQGKTQHVITAVQGELPKTDDAPKYETAIISAKVLGWVKDSIVHTKGTISPGDTVGLLLDRTNFYAEQGGQVGDTGTIDKPETPGVEFRVDNTQRLGDTVLHVGVMLSGEIAIGDTVQVMQTTFRRIDVMRNHTGTHLLNLALRNVLGTHIEQKGSLVDDGKTRFDFSHDKPVTDDELRRIEAMVNERISRDAPVTAVVMPLAKAKEIPGVRAVFGEKYPDPVRVVLIGPEKPELATHDDSVEFCGGTHMPRTGSIGLFKVVSEEGVSKGVRRLTAVTGRVAHETVATISQTLDTIAAKFQCKPEELVNRVDDLQSEVKKLKAAVAKNQAAELANAVDALLAEAPEIGGAKIVVGQLPDSSVDAVRGQIDRVRQKHPSSFIVFAWVAEDGKVPVLAALTKDLIGKGLKAGEIVKQVAAVVGGTGGGKPDLAQAGGKDASKIGEALAKARELAKSMIK
jgi:alanyl-tRNA synthetase